MGKKDGVRPQELNAITAQSHEVVNLGKQNNQEMPLLPIESRVPLESRSESILLSPPRSSWRAVWQTIKNKVRITTAGILGAVGSAVYVLPSRDAAVALSPVLGSPAMLSSFLTNTGFNTEALLNLLPGNEEQTPYFNFSNAKSISILSFSVLSSFFCVLPAYLMAIVDPKSGEYVEDEKIALQSIAAVILIVVNVVGSKNLIENFLTKIQPREHRHQQLIQQMQKKLELFWDLPDNEKTADRLTQLLKAAPEQHSIGQKITRYTLQSGLVVVASTQFFAFVLLSYFESKKFTKKNWNFSESEQEIAGIVAATGNAIPSAGFLYMGITLLATILLDSKWSLPSAPMGAALIAALFSGFASSRGMKLTLDHLQVNGAIVPVLCTMANLSTVFEYNLPGVILFFRRFSNRYKRLSSVEMQQLQQNLLLLLEKTNEQENIVPESYDLRKRLIDSMTTVVNSEKITSSLKEEVAALQTYQAAIPMDASHKKRVSLNLSQHGLFREPALNDVVEPINVVVEIHSEDECVEANTGTVRFRR